MGDEKLADEYFRKRLRLAFHGLEKARHGWLVVIGHAMKELYVSEALKELDGKNQRIQNDFELLWIIPEAYQRCAPTVREDGTHRSTWEEWMNTKMEQREKGDAVDSPDHPSGPLPGTALEFTYDLWTEYKRVLRERLNGT